jgi:hypothetical protein
VREEAEAAYRKALEAHRPAALEAYARARLLAVHSRQRRVNHARPVLRRPSA